MSPVLASHRPTLAELVRARAGRRGIVAVMAVAVLAAALLAFLVLRPEDDGIEVVSRAEPAPFNLRHAERLERVAPGRGELLRLEATRGDLFVQSFAVAPLRLPAYRGDVTGVLPAFAAREIDALRARFAEFELVQDGKTRVNEVAGYQILFRARLGRRRLFGRLVLLPEPEPGARDGVRLLMQSTPAGGASKAADVGVIGLTKLPFRTFRFGTEPP